MKFDVVDGMIFCAKGDGRLLHTLNDADDFARKLRQLEMILPKAE